MKKNILILYAHMGKGHISAAKATKEALDYLFKNKINTEIIDFFSLVSGSFSKTIEKAYDSSVKYIPIFYKTFFELSDSPWPIKFLNKINYPMLSTAIKKVLKEKKPDIIISTFPIWDYGVAQMWKKKNPNAKFITIITDSIYIHHAWLVADADFRIVPNKDTAKTLIEKGIPPDKIKILGFPVRLEFLKNIKKQNVLSKLNLDPKLFTILLFATLGNNTKNIQIFEKIICKNRDYNVICVTGRNKTIIDKIKHLKKEKNVAILGWTQHVPKLMKASDLIITKAGGATVMECIASQKPMIITQIIPGQEEGNAELIKRYSLGIILKNGKKGIDELPKIISEIRKNYTKYKNNLAKQTNPEAALKIAQFINSLLD
jgi:UDP-N-acetylglucosamine:LPS N-acetylglucosamine transferase